MIEPTHYLYSKTSEFLNKGPSWNLERLPSYWMDQILLRKGTDDDASYREIRWLLDVVLDGLQTHRVSGQSTSLCHFSPY